MVTPYDLPFLVRQLHTLSSGRHTRAEGPAQLDFCMESESERKEFFLREMSAKIASGEYDKYSRETGKNALFLARPCP